MWGGAVVTVLLVVVWVVSVFCYCGYFKAGRIIGLYNAKFVVTSHVNMKPAKYDGWHIGQQGSSDAWDDWFDFQTNYARGRVLVPLWPFVLASLSITLAAWRLDAMARRRDRLTFCTKCRCDRRSVAAEEACPACGESPINSAILTAMTPRMMRVILPIGYILAGGIVMFTDSRLVNNFPIILIAGLPAVMILSVVPLPLYFGVLTFGGIQYFCIGYGIDRAIGMFRYSRNRKREAATPACKSRGFSLRGLDGTRCPECGATSSTTTPAPSSHALPSSTPPA